MTVHCWYCMDAAEVPGSVATFINLGLERHCEPGHMQRDYCRQATATGAVEQEPDDEVHF